jgi:hypothetical protein
MGARLLDHLSTFFVDRLGAGSESELVADCELPTPTPRPGRLPGPYPWGWWPLLVLAGSVSAGLALASCSKSTSGDNGRDASPGDSTAGDSPVALPDAGGDAPLDATTADGGANDAGAQETSAAEAGNGEAALAYPAVDFIFGFDQVAGTVASPWPLTDAQLTVLRDDFGMNTMRIFVHPRSSGSRK